MKRTFLFLVLVLLPGLTFCQVYSAGEEVEVEVEGIWFDAIVTEASGKKIKVRYVEESTGEFWVKAEEVRKKKSAGGSTTIEYSTGAMDPEQEKQKELEEEPDKDSPVVVEEVVVTLHNTCDRKREMMIGDEKFSLDANQKNEVKVQAGSLVYSVNAAGKVIKGKVTPKLTTFFPDCE